jgi:hypothetical protein
MKSRVILIVAAMLLLTSTGMFAQQSAADASSNVAFWVAYWGRPRATLFGPAEEAFNQNMQPIMFKWDQSNDPTDPGALDSNVRWLKDHPDTRFFIDGYASSRGDLVYNLALSQRRADWIKQTLVSRGIAESRIVVTAGWGQLYPVCPELNDECWSKNRLVRFVYSPN